MSPATRVVLLVEDNPADADLLEESFLDLERHHTIHTVGDGEAALDFLYRRGAYGDAPTPDLVLLDLNLPKKDGRQVLAEAKADPGLRRIPILVLSSSRSPADVSTCYDLGANGYLKKPVDLGRFQDLVAAIDTFWFGMAEPPTPTGETV